MPVPETDAAGDGIVETGGGVPGRPAFEGARATEAGAGSPPGNACELAPDGTPAAGVPLERMGVPHILQKFMPGGLTVRQAGQVGPTGVPATGVGARTRVAGKLTPPGTWSGNMVGAEPWFDIGNGCAGGGACGGEAFGNGCAGGGAPWIACAGPVPGPGGKR